MNRATQPKLSRAQRAHVASVYPEIRDDMAAFLASAASVGIVRQKETGPDVPPFAIYVKSQGDFWIDCCKTQDKAITRVRTLGLTLS